MKKKAAKSRGGPGRLPAEDAAKVEDRLLDAAQLLISQGSFADISMEQIARQAGASTKTLYSRFPDKGAVIRAVVDRMVARALAAAAQTTPLDPARTDPRRFIVALGSYILTSISGEASALIRIALSEGRRFPEIVAHYNATMTRGRAIFQNALEQWHQAGLLPELKDPPMAASLLVSMLTDMGRVRVALGQPMTAREIEAHIRYAADLFLRGLGYSEKA